MNCLEFRRLTLVEPDSRDADYLRHRRDCAACAAYAGRSAVFEDSLREALALDVPTDLLPGLLLEQAIATEQPQPQRPRWRGPTLALAASLLVMTLAGWLGLRWFSGAQQSFPDEAIAHIEHEIEHLHEPGEVGDAKVAALLGSFGGRVEQDLGTVRYAGSCTLRNKKGVHMVLAGDKGPVTVFYVPGDKPVAVSHFSGDGYEGELVPAGDGSLAVIGEQGEPLEPIIARLDRAIAWGP